MVVAGTDHEGVAAHLAQVHLGAEDGALPLGQGVVLEDVQKVEVETGR